jgi:hypothetical protein
MNCAVLTFLQKESLIGVFYAADSIFNPVEDFYENWVIFEPEYSTNIPELSWVNDLPKIEFVPKPIPIPELSQVN